MTKRKKLIACILVPLYLGTWIGGWISHAHDLRGRAEIDYRWFERRNLERQADGLDYHPIRLNPDGPSSSVNWCIPVLPGVLLVDSEISSGPMAARGGVKIVLYYGVGSMELCTLVGWMT